MERYLVENCSPTLASLKTGNLFSYKYVFPDDATRVRSGILESVHGRERGIRMYSEDPKADGIDLRIQKKLS